MRIGNYEFEGPIDAIDGLEDAAGLCAIVSVGESGACLLVGVKYFTNVKEAIVLLAADPSWQESIKGSQIMYGVLYAGEYLEEDLKRALKDLQSQNLVACVL